MLINRNNGIIKLIYSLLFKRSCINCGVNILSKNYNLVCEECANSLKPIVIAEKNICSICSGKCYAIGKDICYSCFQTGYHFNQNQSIYFYHHPIIQQLVHLFKFESNKKAGKDLGLLLQKPLIEYFRNHRHKLMIVVPLSTGSYRERGFNQVKFILDLNELSYLDILMRKEHSGHQSQLNRREREVQIQGQFRVKEDSINIIANKEVVLIDDVFTTGSTAQECSRVLLELGAQFVEILTFFRS